MGSGRRSTHQSQSVCKKVYFFIYYIQDCSSGFNVVLQFLTPRGFCLCAGNINTEARYLKKKHKYDFYFLTAQTMLWGNDSDVLLSLSVYAAISYLKAEVWHTSWGQICFKWIHRFSKSKKILKGLNLWLKYLSFQFVLSNIFSIYAFLFILIMNSSAGWTYSKSFKATSDP